MYFPLSVVLSFRVEISSFHVAGCVWFIFFARRCFVISCNAWRKDEMAQTKDFSLDYQKYNESITLLLFRLSIPLIEWFFLTPLTVYLPLTSSTTATFGYLRPCPQVSGFVEFVDVRHSVGLLVRVHDRLFPPYIALASTTCLIR